jgi:hypothetical protein
MPSDIAVLRNLTYQKAGAGSPTDLQNWPRIFLECIEGGPDWLAEYRGRDGVTPYRDGQRAGVWRPNRLGIMLSGAVQGTGADEDAQRSDTAQARQELFDLFEGRLPGGLSLDTEDGVTWAIDARVETVLWGPPPAPTYQPIVVRLIAIDPPYWTASGS